MAGPYRKGTNDCADEVTLSRKGAKSRRRTALRLKTTKGKTHVDRIRAANADLKKRLAEALEQQTATSEVLRVISSSAGNLKRVFEAMLVNAARLCEANFGVLTLHEDGRFRAVASHNLPPAYKRRVAGRSSEGFRPHPLSSLGCVAATKQFAHRVNYDEDPAYKAGDPVAVRPNALIRRTPPCTRLRRFWRREA